MTVSSAQQGVADALFSALLVQTCTCAAQPDVVVLFTCFVRFFFAAPTDLFPCFACESSPVLDIFFAGPGCSISVQCLSSHGILRNGRRFCSTTFALAVYSANSRSGSADAINKLQCYGLNHIRSRTVNFRCLTPGDAV